MTGPEYLTVEGSRRGRGRLWVVLALVLVVLAGITVYRVTRTDSGPVPDRTDPPPSTPSPTSHGWPAGLPSGTLVVTAAGRVQTLDAGSGLVTRTKAEVDPGDTSLTPLTGGVLAWQNEGSRKQIVLLGGLATYPVRGALRRASAFLPGPDGTVWAGEGEQGREKRWRKVDLDGHASTTVTVSGTAAGDGADGLLDVQSEGLTRVYPRPPTAWQPGDVVATGPDGYLVRSCLATRCSSALRHRADGRTSYLTVPMSKFLSNGALSPQSRFVTLTEFNSNIDALAVYALDTGRAVHTFSEPGHVAHSAVWLDDRWLALVSEDQLMLYDTSEDQVFVPAVTLSSIGPLVWLPADPAR